MLKNIMSDPMESVLLVAQNAKKKYSIFMWCLKVMNDSQQR